MAMRWPVGSGRVINPAAHPIGMHLGRGEP